MFGVDPDTAVPTVRVGSGSDFGRAREVVRGLTRVVILGLEVRGSAEGKGLRREKRRGSATVFEDRKRPTFDRL